MPDDIGKTRYSSTTRPSTDLTPVSDNKTKTKTKSVSGHRDIKPSSIKMIFSNKNTKNAIRQVAKKLGERSVDHIKENISKVDDYLNQMNQLPQDSVNRKELLEKGHVELEKSLFYDLKGEKDKLIESESRESGVHSVSHGFRPGLTGELEKCQSVERRGRSPWQGGRDSSRENGETGSTVVYVAGRYEKCCMKYCI